jgi:GT2 family glycosyltransferase
MYIHAIVVSHNTQALTDNCLSYLSRALSGLDSVITVVDNASEDDTPLMVRSKYPEVHLFANARNQGFAAACNLAVFSIPEVHYDLFVNSDTEPHTDVVTQMRQYMDEHPNCAALGCRLTNWDGTPQHSFANWPRFGTEFLGKKIFSLLFPKKFPGKRNFGIHPLPVESLVGAFFMVRHADFMAVQGFDERYFFFFEETDLCRRFWERGRAVIFHPDFTVKHKQGASANKNPKWARHQFYRSKYQFLLKWESKKICALIYLKNLFYFALKTFFYFLIHTLTLRMASRLARKEAVAFWIWKQHIFGFPPFLDLSKTHVYQDSQGNSIFSFLKSEENGELLKKLTQPENPQNFQCMKQSKVASTIQALGLYPDKEKTCVLKIQHPDFWTPFKVWIQQGFGLLNFKNSARLQSIGISVPSPIAWGKFQNSPWGKGGFFLNVLESDTVVLNFFEDCLRKRFQGLEFWRAKRALIQQLALKVRTLHDRCVFHYDLKASNILLDLKSVTLLFRFRFVWVDLEKIRYGYFFNTRLAVKNLVQLNKSFSNFSTLNVRERLRFLSVYLGHHISRKEKRSLLSSITTWTELILKRKRANKLRR